MGQWQIESDVVIQFFSRLSGTALVSCCLLVTCSSGVMAAEYLRQDQPVSSSAGGLEDPLTHAFQKKEGSDDYLLSSLKTALADSASFWRNAKLEVDLRGYRFERSNTVTPDAKASAVGGQMRFTSGNWRNLSLTAAWYNSIDVDSNRGPSGLTTRPGKNINVLGEANLRYDFKDSVLSGSRLTLYRQTLSLPYLNKNDIRMLPSTHEGYTLGRENSDLDYIVGHITRFKSYRSDRFVHMSEAAGAVNSDDGVSLAGVQVPVTPHGSLGVINYYGWNTFNTVYLEASYHRVVAGDLDMRLSGQHTDQRSTGDELVGDFSTYHSTARVALGWRGAVLRLGGSTTSKKSGIRAPWGGKPSYLSLMRSDFDRPGEDAILLGFSYNTEYFSSMGLSSYVNIAHGRNARNLNAQKAPHRTEYDLTIDYKPPSGLLEGLWARLRYAYLDTSGSGTVHDVRLILNYSIPLL